MQKLFFTLLAALMIMSCDDETKPKELEVLDENIQLDFGDSVKINATSDYEITYEVSDPYLLSVNNGMIKGRHVGLGTVTINSNGLSKMIPVKVKSKYSIFPDPIETYNKTQDYYISKLGRPDDQTDSTLVYRYYAGSSGLVLFFDEMGILEVAGLYYTYNKANNVCLTLMERYELYDRINDTFYFGNAIDYRDADILTSCILFKSDDICVATFQKNNRISTQSVNPEFLRKLLPEK